MIQIVLLRTREEKGVKRVYHCHPSGFPTGLSVPDSHSVFQNLGLILEKLRTADPDNLKNVYYTVAHHAGLGQGMPSRIENTFEKQTVVAFDLDHVEQTRAWDYLPIVARILGVPAGSLVFVSTGNGLHIIAHLEKQLLSVKYLKETKPHYNEIVYQINEALKDAGLPGNADPAIFDAPRILRLPNTINEKPGKKGEPTVVREAKLLQYPGLLPLDLDLRKISGLDQHTLEKLSPRELKKNYPRPDFPEVMSQCEFMKWVVKNPEEVHEPQFMSAVGVLGAMSPGDKFTWGNHECSAHETAGKIFDQAVNSQSLARGDFERKWDHGIRYGAPRCQTISNNWLGGCEKCPHFNKINTPLALRSKEHLKNAGNGYWVMAGKNGDTPKHPDYSDLLKIYRQAFSFVSVAPDRVFTFNQTHYGETHHLHVKAWVDKAVGHIDHLREAHCVEFLKKILRTGATSEQEEVDLFERSTSGKLNCSNGVLDVRTGELLPHASNYGFKYVLPYDFQPDLVSEPFLNWLAEVMLDRTDLMDAVLDMMSYCLWPGYEDHVFAYFVGEGRNGKSTLLHLIQALVGRYNYSAISLQQLGENRFAAANLEGKLVNLSEESSGIDLSMEALNIIKDLSAGGDLQVERKNQQGFTLRNHAKLIFSANKTPRFHEQGRAIRSRMLVVPFEHTFDRPDPRVEDMLMQEIPKICSMLVARIQEKLKADGKFKVYRGGADGQQAQDKVLMAGNSLFEWAKQSIESSVDIPEEQYIACKEAYSKYTYWCQENGAKAVNSTTFGYHMTRGVLSGAVKESRVIKVGNKPTRVYPHTRWKEEIE